jgi:di/tricarboxylate transporter
LFLLVAAVIGDSPTSLICVFRRSAAAADLKFGFWVESTMNAQLVLVLTLLLACIGLFVANKPRMDVVALLVIVVLPLSGITSVPETLAGFSDPNVILIAAMFVLGEGLVRTGIAYKLGEWLVKKAGGNETRLLTLMEKLPMLMARSPCANAKKLGGTGPSNERSR